MCLLWWRGGGGLGEGNDIRRSITTVGTAVFFHVVDIDPLEYRPMVLFLFRGERHNVISKL